MNFAHMNPFGYAKRHNVFENSIMLTGVQPRRFDICKELLSCQPCGVIIILLLILLICFFLSWVNAKRKWVKLQQEVISTAFSRSTKDCTETSSPAISVSQAETVDNVVQGIKMIDLVQNDWNPHDFDDLDTDYVNINPYLTPEREVTPKRSTNTGLVTPAGRTKLYLTPPSTLSVVTRSQSKPIRTFSPFQRNKVTVDHDYVRVDQCGRIHSAPEDHNMSCAPSTDDREQLVEDRDHILAQRVRSKRRGRLD